MPVTPALRRWRQEEAEQEASTVGLCLKNKGREGGREMEGGREDSQQEPGDLMPHDISQAQRDQRRVIAVMRGFKRPVLLN
jgi:hypothetical protein